MRKPLHLKRKIIIFPFLLLLLTLSIVVVNVNAVGIRPVADFTWSPETPFVREMVIFNASSSYDPDGYIVSYSWRFALPDFDVLRSGMIVNFTFQEAPYLYNVFLTVTDNDNLNSSYNVLIWTRLLEAQAFSLSPTEKKHVTNLKCLYNNTEFEVDVVITNITDCAAYQFKIDYNSTLLAVVSKTFNTDPANPLSPTQMAPLATEDRIDTDKSSEGSIRLATVWKAGVPPYSYVGDSVAGRITFKIIYCPPQLLHVNNTVSCNVTFDSLWTSAFDVGGYEILFAAFNDGYYEYTTLVKLAGDVDGDLDIDLDDQFKVQLAMFTVLGDPRWNPYADISEDGDVDVGDQRKQQLYMFTG